MTTRRLLPHAVAGLTVCLLLTAGGSRADAGTRVYVRVGPPAPLVQVRPTAPARDYVWVPGYHRWSDTGYVWVAGGWRVPPRHRASWVPGHWQHDRRGWYYVDGHWR